MRYQGWRACRAIIAAPARRWSYSQPPATLATRMPIAPDRLNVPMIAPRSAGSGGSNYFDLYDLSGGCRDEATAVACGHIESGIRVYDIRDPFHPKEIAYYNPPAKPGYQAGSNFNSTGDCTTVDWASSMPRFRADRGELWVTSQCNGFQVLKFIHGVWPPG